MKRRIVSFLLAMAVALSLLPAAAMAEETARPIATETTATYSDIGTSTETAGEEAASPTEILEIPLAETASETAPMLADPAPQVEEGALTELAFSATASKATNKGDLAISPAFASDIHEYTVYLKDSQSNVYIWATQLASLTDSIECTYQKTTGSSSRVSVTSGKLTGTSLTTIVEKNLTGNTLTITVGAQTYTVNFARVCTLSTLTAKVDGVEYTLNETLNATESNYSMTLPYGAEPTVSAVAYVAAGTVVTVNGKAPDTALTLDWSADKKASLTVAVYQEGSEETTKNTYTVQISGGPDDMNGLGTAEDPFLLRTGDDLKALSDAVAAGSTFRGFYFLLTDDITLPADWTPIGSLKDGATWATKLDYTGYHAFSGTIDGGNHTVTVPAGSRTLLGAVSGGKLCNLNIYGTKIDGYGVVEYYYVDKANSVKVEIDHVTIKSGTHTKYAGFIGGYASGIDTVIIRNCTVEEGVVIGDDGTYNDWNEDVCGEFEYPYGPTGLQLNDMIGSFGGCFNGTIENCVSHAKVYGRNYVGGILGFKGQSMGECIVRNCTFDGEVHATGKYAGGIVGGGYCGGTGHYAAPNTPASTIENCLCSGSVTGATCVGGIFGGEEHQSACWNNGVGYIRGNYCAGTVTATAQDGIAGGVIGYLNSLNRYNVISGNYYSESAAAKGIGGVNTGNVDTSTPQYGRADDPFGADLSKLAASVTEAESSSGALTADLNRAGAGHGWTGTVPTHSTLRRVVRLASAELNSNPELKVKSAGLSQSTAITAYYSDGTSGVITLGDCVVNGPDMTKTGYQLCTALYGGYTICFGVNVTETAAASADGSMQVTVSVLGDTIHNVTATNCHSLAAGNLTAWINSVSVTVPKDTSALDAVKKAAAAYGLSITDQDSYYGGKYVSAVTSADGVCLTDRSNQQTDGNSYCGWMYTVNGESSWNAISDKKLENGDAVVLYFEDDYNLPYVQGAIDAIDAIRGDLAKVSCDKLKTARDSVAYFSPVAIEKVTNYGTLENALAHIDQINHATGWTVISTPTCTHTGESAINCTACGYQATRTDAALHHSMTYTPAQAATCVATGTNAYYHCSRCDQYFKDAEGNTPTTEAAETLAALNHSMTYTPAKAATAEATGNVAYWSCDQCQKLYLDAQGKHLTNQQAVTTEKINTTAIREAARDGKAVKLTDATAETVKISKEVFQTVMANTTVATGKVLELTMGENKIAMDKDVLALLANDVTLTITGEATHTAEQTAAIGNKQVVDIDLTVGNDTITDLNGGVLEVTIPATTANQKTAGRRLVAKCIKADGTSEAVNCSYDADGNIVLELKHLSTYVIYTEAVNSGYHGGYASPAKSVVSARTGDMGVVIYFAMGAMSYIGSAAWIRKRKDEM